MPDNTATSPNRLSKPADTAPHATLLDSAASDTTTDRLDRLITQLYACVDHNNGFEPFLQCIKEELNLVSCSLAAIQKEPQMKGLYGWAVGYPPGVIPLMLKTGLVFKDEAISRALEMGPNALFSFADGKPDHDILASMPAFTRTWVRAAGIIDSATVAFTNKYQQHIVLVFNRHKSATIFSTEEMALISRLRKHVEIAVDLYERVHRSEQGFKDLQSSISMLKQPVAVFSPVGAMVTASPAFRELGRNHDVFEVNEESREIEFRNEPFSQQFHTQLMLYITGETSALDDSDTLYLETPALPLRFSLTPVQNQGNPTRNVLVEIFDPNQTRELSVNEIRKVIHATESEARVCLALLKGADPAETAEQLGLAVSTVRSYIKTLLSKNNFNRQVDLVTHLLRICS
ncbi:hypothetical protein MWU49_05550 [Alcanivorax sp. S6407]|uniref:helix-turn-helix transcriptional regulator n=1 Tax=Alcanivorax sp. S6407 TaxID=2926424 RepID=UPI001FF2AD55|nr:hypothetical protein [Alcanivorax sp. S6407]MCK0153155.1 hypothetical protein [Alcanivorax sp. S6407]